MRRRVRPLLLALAVLACNHSEPDGSSGYGPDYDTEIAQAAPIGDPARPLTLRLSNVGGLLPDDRSFPGEDINLVPSGGFGFGFDDFRNDSSDGDYRGRTEHVFDRALQDIGVDIRGLGGEAGSLTALDDVASGRRDSRTRPTHPRGPSTLPPNATRILVGESDELPLSACEATVRVEGFRARIVLDLLFVNDRERILEGTFQLRLPSGASPCYFSFGETEWEPGRRVVPSAGPPRTDFEGITAARREQDLEPKVARMVRRKKAAHAYAETTRRRVDPALMEWAGAGVFSARVFPLTPGRTHRIAIAYDVDLAARGPNLDLDLELPRAARRSATLDVDDAPGIVVEPPTDPDRRGGRALHRFESLPGGRLSVTIPDPGAVLLTGEDEAIGPCFALRFTPDLPVEDSPGAARAVFLVDVSLSSRLDRWIPLMRRILDANRDDLREFAVLFFSIDATWWRPGLTANTEANVESLLRLAEVLEPAGATDLDLAIRTAISSGLADGGCDLFLLSDGRATWGGGEPAAMEEELRAAGVGPLFAYRTGRPGTDLGTLQRLGRATGGAVFDLGAGADLELAARAHRQRPFRIASISGIGVSDLLVRGRPASAYPGQTLVVSGRGRPGPAGLTLHLRRDGEPRAVPIRADRTVPDSGLAARTHGQCAVSQLEEAGGAAEETAASFATWFRVVGGTCSLLMLETEEDYERFDIPGEDAVRAALAAPVTAALGPAREASRGAGADPREAIRALLRDLSRAPGLRFELDDGLRDRIARLPDRAFLPGAAADPAALRELSGKVEQAPGDPGVAREVAYEALARNLGGAAVPLLLRVARSRPFEADTWRLLARACARAGKPDLAALYFEVAIAGEWDGRFGGFREIAAMDYARHLGRAGEATGGLVVTITWNTDRTDVDLHVTDPAGEMCFYSHPETRAGGRLSGDVTAGYGPERFLLPRPPRGEYQVALKLYSSDTLRTRQTTKVHLEIIEGWGTPEERIRTETVAIETSGKLETAARIRVR